MTQATHKAIIIQHPNDKPHELKRKRQKLIGRITHCQDVGLLDSLGEVINKHEQRCGKKHE